MVYDVILSKKAEARLSHAVGYIADVLCSPAAAKRLLASFDFIIDSLKTSPSFAVVAKEPSRTLGRTVYQKKIGKYKVLFCIDEARQQVIVFSFFHELQDERSIVRQDYSEI